MILPPARRQSHCSGRACCLKLLCALAFGLACRPTPASQEQVAPSPLGRELAALVAAGRTAEALQRVQSALREAPDDPTVRSEYRALHLTLARDWLAQRRFDDCLTAVAALLALQPDDPAALTIQRKILAARAEAEQQLPEIDRLLRLELFDSALEKIRDVQALRPELADALVAWRNAAWQGAADDHYLAGNFSAAFALYEHVLCDAAPARPHVVGRWALALALALLESDATCLAADVARWLLERTSAPAARQMDDFVRQAVRGLLSESTTPAHETAQAYAAALGADWELPPADQRGAALARLRAQVGERLRAVYQADCTRRRDGAWQIILPGTWKRRSTDHFEVYARNDLVAQRLAEAAEFHAAGLAAWLGVPLESAWEPRCELRIHATLDELRQATWVAGEARALTRTRIQGGRVLLRTIDLWQDDPWLLSASLPHELTHVLLVAAHPDAGFPSAIELGLALQAEPYARRLRLRRLLQPPVPALEALLAASAAPGDETTFPAYCDALMTLLLHRAGEQGPSVPGAQPVSAVLETFAAGCSPGWWQAFGWPGLEALERDWREWCAARANPPRMPLMVLAQPGEERRHGGP